MQTHTIRFRASDDLYQLLEQESHDFDSWNKMMNRICREYFLHRQLKTEFQKLDKGVVTNTEAST